MNIFERMNAWLDRSEASWVTLLTKFLPILVPIIPAFQTKYHVVTVLGYEEWMGWAAAVVVEFFGYGAMYKMIQFAFKKAGFWMIAFTVVIYLMYLVIILVFNVIPEVETGKPAYIIWMNALFSLLSVPAGALTAISAVHTEREEANREQKERERAERKVARERRREQQAANTPEQPNSRTPNTRRTPNARTVPMPSNERKFSPFPNTDHKHRIEQTAEQLNANGIPPSVRNIQRALRLQDFEAVNHRAPTPEEEQSLTGWSTSTISQALKREE